MKINIRPAGSGGYTTIANDQAGDLIDFKLPSLSLKEMTEPGYGASGQVVINLGNGLWQINLPITKWYASAYAVRQAVATLGALFNVGNIDLQILESNGTDAMYMAGASIPRFVPDQQHGQQGIALIFTLTITGPSYSVTAP